jgi:hypothetical protein
MHVFPPQILRNLGHLYNDAASVLGRQTAANQSGRLAKFLGDYSPDLYDFFGGDDSSSYSAFNTRGSVEWNASDRNDGLFLEA